MAALAACLIFWLLLKDFTACTMTKNDSESPAINQPTTGGGLNVPSTLLADKPVPLKIEDSKLVPNRANESTKNETKPAPTDICQPATFTTADGVNVTSVTLAINLVPSKLEDSRLTPRQAKELFKKYTKYSLQRKARLKATIDKPKEMIAALGSTETIYSLGDIGLLSAVLTAYNNHWKLRTSPDDWWFSVIKRVASAIDKNAKKESVRKMFVHHKGKKTIKYVCQLIKLVLTLSNLKQEVVYQKGNPNLYYHSELAEHTSNSRALIPAVNMGTTDNIKLCKDCDALYLLPSNSYSVYSRAKSRFLTTMHHFYFLFPSINLTDGLN
ncbi:hypothetical protein OS493_007284 [Desmophyllum pertusum]|uniref:Uncharacterized protein n=1 Tax=Desmophyllum pertusum TaxID=174260 RepID=A0A9W9Z3A6_9CNID|nr:hypothetical protein OS493_007284 [Desmophyllum pertusum]